MKGQRRGEETLQSPTYHLCFGPDPSGYGPQFWGSVVSERALAGETNSRCEVEVRAISYACVYINQYSG